MNLAQWTAAFTALLSRPVAEYGWYLTVHKRQWTIDEQPELHVQYTRHYQGARYSVSGVYAFAPEFIPHEAMMTLRTNDLVRELTNLLDLNNVPYTGE